MRGCEFDSEPDHWVSICKLSSQHGSQSAGYAGRASACTAWTGSLPESAPAVIYLSVGVERAQRHGLARDPHRTPSRTAHRARIGLAGKAGTRLRGGARMECIGKRKSRVLGLGYLTTRTGPGKHRI